MRSASLALLLPMLTAPVLLGMQVESRPVVASVKTSELNLVLEPGLIVDSVPVSFIFHLVNVGEKDLRIPEPYVDCGNATTNGSMWLNESWQPSTGTGLGKGTGICDFGGSGLPSPPITEVAKKWHLLKPGESFYLEANQAGLHFDSSNPGVYTFSAVYLPPSLSDSQVRDLERAGIAIPRWKATSANLRYEKR